MIFSTLTDKEYVKAGGYVCPVCEGYDLERLSGIEVEDGAVWQSMSCRICGAEWANFYSPYRYDIENTPDIDSLEDMSAGDRLGNIEVARTYNSTNVFIARTNSDDWSVLVKSKNRVAWFTNKDNIRIEKIKDANVKRDVLRAFDDIALMAKLSQGKED